MSTKAQNQKKKKVESPKLNVNSSLENQNKSNEKNSPKTNNIKEKESKKSNNKSKKNNKKGLEQANSKVKINEKPKEEPKKVVVEAKVVDELPKDHVLVNKIKNITYKIIYVFHNQDFFITVKPELIMINLFKRISKKLNVSIDKITISYKEHEITEKYTNMTVKEFFNFPINKSRPILYVKIKQNSTSKTNSPNKINSEIEKYSIFYKRSYDNKVKIMNYPSMIDINVGVDDDIYNVVNSFLKEINITSDFTCERKEENKNKNYKEKAQTENIEINQENSNLNSEFNNLEENKTNTNTNDNNTSIVYYIGFPTPDIAFDFNRYMNTLRIMNPTFKNIKVNVLLSRKQSQKKNKLNIDLNENSKRHYQSNYNYRYGTSINLEETDLKKRNIEILNIVRNNFLNNKINGLMKVNNSVNYLNISSPYKTPYEEKIKEEQENKKKWLSPRGFISCVNRNNGMHV